MLGNEWNLAFRGNLVSRVHGSPRVWSEGGPGLSPSEPSLESGPREVGIIQRSMDSVAREEEGAATGDTFPLRMQKTQPCLGIRKGEEQVNW